MHAVKRGKRCYKFTQPSAPIKGLQALRGGGHHGTHNLIEVDFGFSNGFPGSADGEWYSIVHEHLMKLCYRGRIRVVDDWMVGIADG